MEDHAGSNYREEKRSIPEEDEEEEEEDKWQHMEDVRRMPEPDASDAVASGPRAPNPYEQQVAPFILLVTVSSFRVATWASS